MHGLAALLELQASRMATRTAPDGEPVLLADQNRARWNRMLIRRGLEALLRGRRRTLLAPGGHRRLPCPGRPIRGHRLGDDRRASTAG